MDYEFGPAPDPAKLAGLFAEWEREEVLPGRLLANLKTGRLPEILESANADSLLEIWEKWETGTMLPLPVAQGLLDRGLVDLLGDLAEA